MAKSKLSRSDDFDFDWGDDIDYDFDSDIDLADDEYDFEFESDFDDHVDDFNDKTTVIDFASDESGLTDEQAQYQAALQAARLSMQEGFGFGQFGAVDFSVEDDDTSFNDIGRNRVEATNEADLFDVVDPAKDSMINDYESKGDLPSTEFDFGQGVEEDEEEEDVWKPQSWERSANKFNLFDDLGSPVTI